MDDPLLEPLEHSSLDAPLDAETINALEIHSVDGDTATVEATDLDTRVANGSDSSKSNGKTVLPL
jgi:hypothetical protein